LQNKGVCSVFREFRCLFPPDTLESDAEPEWRPGSECCDRSEQTNNNKQTTTRSTLKLQHTTRLTLSADITSYLHKIIRLLQWER